MLRIKKQTYGIERISRNHIVHQVGDSLIHKYSYDRMIAINCIQLALIPTNKSLRV